MITGFNSGEIIQMETSELWDKDHKMLRRSMVSDNLVNSDQNLEEICLHAKSETEPMVADDFNSDLASRNTSEQAAEQMKEFVETNVHSVLQPDELSECSNCFHSFPKKTSDSDVPNFEKLEKMFSDPNSKMDSLNQEQIPDVQQPSEPQQLCPQKPRASNTPFRGFFELDQDDHGIQKFRTTPRTRLNIDTKPVASNQSQSSTSFERHRVSQNEGDIQIALNDFQHIFEVTHLDPCSGSLVCANCSKAAKVLYRIQFLARKLDTNFLIMQDYRFVRLLVKLCDVKSSEGSRICPVVTPEWKQFLERKHFECFAKKVDHSTAEAVARRILGNAVARVKPDVYTVKFKTLPDNLKISDSILQDQKLQEDSTISKELRELYIEAPEVLDGNHVWGYMNKDDRKEAERICSALFEHFAKTSTETLHCAPEIGDEVGLITSENLADRALVLGVRGSVARLWTIDRGVLLQVSWKALIPLPKKLKTVKPRVALCVLKDIQKVLFKPLFKACVSMLCLLCSHTRDEKNLHLKIVGTLKAFNGFKILCQLIKYEDKDIRITAINCLLSLTQKKYGRIEATRAGCANAILERLKTVLKGSTEPEVICGTELQFSIRLMHNLMFRNSIHMILSATDILILLTEMQERLSSRPLLHYNSSFTLHNLLCPVNAEFMKKPTSDSYFKFSENLHHEDPQKKTKKEKYCVPDNRFYLRGALVRFESDMTHEIGPSLRVKSMSARTLSKITCSFLNTWKNCTVYFGIGEHGYIYGIMLNLEERDALRRGFNYMVDDIRPHLPSQAFSTVFVPAVKVESELNELQDSTYYVVELNIFPVSDTLYRLSDGACYLRERDVTFKARAYDIRQWFEKHEIEKYE